MSSPVQPLPATMPLAFSDFTVVTSLGRGRDNTVVALREGRSALASCTFDDFPFPTYVGEIAGLDAAPLRGEFAGFDCRNNRLAAITLREDNFIESVAVARQRHGAARIGVFVGTSTSGLQQTEAAYRRLDPITGRLPPDFDYSRTHNTYSLARFVREALGLAGPAFVVSTACAATAKVFATAAQNDRRRRLRCSGRRRCRYIVCHDTLRIPFARSDVGGALPAFRFRALRHFNWRGGGVRPARAARSPAWCRYDSASWVW